jgi:hypothetical protein
VPSLSVPLPLRVVEFVGSVKVISLPALAAGAWLGAAFTTTVTLSVSVAPALSVTVNLNTYVPCTRLVSAVDALEGSAMVYVAGPLTRLHA